MNLIKTNNLRLPANDCRLVKICFIFLVIPYLLVFAGEIDTLAVINENVITTEDYTKLYNAKLRETGINDNYDVRVKYLQNLVDDQLLIEYSKSMGFDKTESAEIELKRIRLQELLNEYTLQKISPRINVIEADLKELFHRFNKKIKVSHLYAGTKEEADGLYNRLLKGADFSQLARENFEDPVLQKNGGSLGYISVDEMDPDFEDAAFSMRVGEVSEPVKTVRGYSIIKVDDIQSNPLITETEYLKSKEKLASFARKRKFERTVKNFVKELNSKLKIKFNESFISKLYKSMEINSRDDINEINSLVSDNELDNVVVDSQFGNWTLRTVINEMKIVTDKQKKWIRNEENLKEFISGLITRKYLEMLALKDNLHESEYYKKQTDFQFESYLLTTIENSIKADIVISPDSIAEYYNRNIGQFVNEPEIEIAVILTESRATSDTVLHKLKSGEAFEKTAKEYSTQTATAQDGGRAGKFKRKDLDYLADDIFMIPKGDWAGPYEYEGKFLFVKNLGIISGKMTLEESSKKIEDLLVSLKYYSEREKLVNSLASKSKIIMYTKKLSRPTL